MKLAFITANEKGGCPHYRMYQVKRWIKKKYPDIKAVMVDEDLKQPEKDLVVQNADLCIVQASHSKEYIDFAWEHKVVFEVDDDMFNTSPLNPTYRENGTDEEVLANINGEMKPIWKEGINGYYPVENARRLDRLRLNLCASDAMTVTTEHLKHIYTDFNEKIYVLNNCIDFERWKPAPIAKTKEIRILWTGGDSHYGDLEMIRPAMEHVSNKYEHVTFVFAGKVWPSLCQNLKRYESHDWVHPTAHAYRTILLNADIGIAPLEDNDFNRGKSPIKWLEYSSMKIPTVASNTVYGTEIYDGLTGYVAQDMTGWVMKLEELIENHQTRILMGQEAYNYVYETHNIEKNIHKWVDAYQQVLGVQHAANVG